MADWNTPSLTTSYTGFLNALKDRDVDIATMFNNGSPQNAPVGAITLNASSTSSTFQRWSGTGWVAAVGVFYAPNFSTTGTINAGGTISTGLGITTGDAALELGGLRTGAGASYVDFHSASGTDFEGRIIRYPGANGAFDMVQTGLGALNLISNNNSPIVMAVNGSERVRIGTDGNVGIGTAAASVKLAVNSGPGVISVMSNTVGSERLHFYTRNGPGISRIESQNSDMQIGCYDNNNLVFFTGNGERGRFDGAGNLGVGIDTPTARLHVKGGGAIISNFAGTGNAPTEVQDWPVPVLALQSYGDYTSQTMMTFGLSNDPNYVTDNAIWNMRLTQTGGATTSAGVQGMSFCGPGSLQLGSAGATRLTLDTAGNATFTGNVGAYSDRRLKANLERIEGALGKVLQLTGYTYDRVDHEGRETGLIAQDVQRVLPEAVNDNGEYLSLAYGNLAGLIVEAIKELSAEVKELKHA